MKTIHYPNKIRSHLITIVPMAPFTLKSTSKLRFALHFRYSIVCSHYTLLSICDIIATMKAEILPLLWCRSAVKNLFYYCNYENKRPI